VELKHEESLILAAKRGDEQALGTLYDAYVDRIYRYIFYRVDNAEVARDLTADVFLRVVEGLPNYEYRSVPFVAWLYRIAHARVVDHFRQASKAQEQEAIENIELSAEDDMDSSLMKAYHQEKVHAAIKQLTPEQQQVVLLRFVEGYNLQKTAEALGKTIGAIKLMQHRALRTLSKELKNQGIVFDQT
jgi:RNA polymerase sigma-70 factor (ECF subfamily)